jgi:hypothetical protein
MVTTAGETWATTSAYEVTATGLELLLVAVVRDAEPGVKFITPDCPLQPMKRATVKIAATGQWRRTVSVLKLRRMFKISIVLLKIPF